MDLIALQRKIALNRDEKAFELLFLFFYKVLVKLAYSITKSKEAAEEIYSDLMLKIWTLGASLMNIINLKTYLYRSIHNASLNYIKKYHKIYVVDIDHFNLDFESINYVEDYVYDKELSKAFQLALQQLPPKCQMVFKLVREKGFTYKEVAEILEISINTVENHMVTALAMLKEVLKLNKVKKRRH